MTNEPSTNEPSLAIAHPDGSNRRACPRCSIVSRAYNSIRRPYGLCPRLHDAFADQHRPGSVRGPLIAIRSAVRLHVSRA
jgi:hypothetical protein